MQNFSCIIFFSTIYSESTLEVEIMTTQNQSLNSVTKTSTGAQGVISNVIIVSIISIISIIVAEKMPG